MKFNVLGEQRKSQIIRKYLDSIAQYEVEGSESGNRVTITVDGSSFNIDTTKREPINSRDVLSR